MARLIGYDYFDDWRGAVTLLNDLGWNLSWKKYEGKWYLYTGDQPLFVGETEGEFQAFLCGAAITLAVLPNSLLEEIRRLANE